MARTLVVVRHGPAAERGWLGLRAALALGLAGHEISVLLWGDGIQLALLEAAPPWLGGDPRNDLLGLVDDLGAEVLVDAAALAAACDEGARLAPPWVAATEDMYAERLAVAGSVLAF